MDNKIYKLAVRRSWETLDYAILVKIFMKLSILDLVSSVCGVCASWRKACSDSTLWGTLDVGALKFGLMNVIQKLSARPIEQCNRMLLPLLNNALTLSYSNVTRLIFDINLNIKDEHLIFAAERCSNLKRLVLPAWNQITAEGLCAAIRKLKGLESLTLPSNYCPNRVIEVVGANCSNLTELKLMSPYDHDFATTLFIYIPNLKILSLRCSLLHKNALNITLMLFDLEELNISHSIIVDTYQTRNPISLHWERDSVTEEKTSQLKNFFACQNDACIMCMRAYKDLGRLKWHKYEEGLWRNDEVSSLAI
ncbi:unnamed protein product [Dovyalis caffra]|uniref:F-box domain-containing protein n=1 Tax=Dovyalis caffra TaxID=77055 RepID=A0AAV1RFW1_9ROSI|nr:unnamed protein product [Dovyalis caffra]